MIILPIGHDEMTVRRLPWATIAIALVCIGVQVRATLVERSAEAARSELRAKIERVVRDGLRQRAAETNGRAATGRRGFRHDPSLAVSLLGEEVQAEVARYREELAALERQHPATRLGYQPGVHGYDRMVTSAFAHGGWLHLVFNLLFLYLVGCNLEDRWGWWRFLLFYAGGALAAGFAFSLWHPGGATLIGASGATAAAMGAFTLVMWSARIRFAYWVGPMLGTFELPAWFALLFWFAEQLFFSWFEASLSMRVAYSAHVGGFAFGLLVAGVAWWVERVRDRRAGLVPAAGPRITQKMEASLARRAAVQQNAQQLLADARRLATEGKARDALQNLDAYLASHPDDLSARELALAAAEAARIDTAIGRHASALIEPWIHKGELARVSELFRFLNSERPDAVLEERALLHVLAVGRTLADNDLLLAAATAYVEHYAGGKEMPRILFVAAEAQEAGGRHDVAQRTLRSLVARFPDDPLGKLAKRRLEAEAAAPSV